MYRTEILSNDKSLSKNLKQSEFFNLNGFIVERSENDITLAKALSGEIDLIMADMDGLNLLKKLREKKSETCVIILSSSRDFNYVRQVFRLGAFDYITLPIENKELEDAINRVKNYLDEKTKGENEDIAAESDIYKQRLLSSLLLGSTQAVIEAENIYNELIKMHGGNYIEGNESLKNIATALNHAIFRNFPWLNRVDDRHTFDLDFPMSSENELKAKFIHVIKDMNDYILKFELHHSDRIIRKTCEYVMVHVEDKINLEVIADEIEVTGSYIGKLFKKITGSNFNDYVTRVKMEHAKNLIKSCNLKNYEISEKLGYSKPDYFGSLFKNYTGYTPAQYKKVKS